VDVKKNEKKSWSVKITNKDVLERVGERHSLVASGNCSEKEAK
jgi:hypothetical protein